MKNLLSITLLLTASLLHGQDKAGTTTLTVHTNAVCDMCVKTIETEMLYEKGVKAVAVDLEANVINVQVDPRKTDIGKIRTAITKIGYAADDLLPDAAARERLPDCCRKEGCGLPAHKEAPEAAPTPEQHP